MNSSTMLSLDSEIVSEAQDLFSSFGMSVERAVNLFLEKAIQLGRFPFEISADVPNEETLEAIKEVEQMKKDPTLGKAYTDVDEMIRELLA